ncbi:hypothetical protein OHJ21_23885 [Virgibacillus sp. LDC1]|nr:hypothetical protein [Virgibacillus sp. LDC1]
MKVPACYSFVWKVSLVQSFTHGRQPSKHAPDHAPCARGAGCTTYKKEDRLGMLLSRLFPPPYYKLE